VFERHEVGVCGGKTLINLLRAYVTNPYLKINTLVGSDGTLGKNSKITDMAVNAGAVAAVNADFFQMGESGRPIGMTYKDGRLVTSPPLRSDMYGWGVTKEGQPLIEMFNFSGKVMAATGKNFPLSGINKPSYLIMTDTNSETTSHENALLMYDRFWGEKSRGKLGDADSVVEVFVSKGIVIEVLANQAGKIIPEDGFVLAARGIAADFISTNIKAGDRIEIDYSVTPKGDSLWAGTGGWSLLVDGGKAMSSFPGAINGAVARTAIGYSSDKKTIFLAAVEKNTGSRGLTLNELADYMVGLKVERALNLDGGGSTTVAVRPLGEEKAVLINRPQNSSQRPVPTALAFFSTAPPGDLAGLILKGPDVVFPGDEVLYTLSGYDSHYSPFPITQSNVAWSVVGPGSIYNNTFKSEDGGLSTIAASFGGLTGKKSVKVLSGDDFSGIFADPVAIDLRPEGEMEISFRAVGRDGTVYPLEEKRFTVSVDPGLGVYEKGVFKAPAQNGSGVMKITFAGLELDVPVTVKSEDQAIYVYSPGKANQITLGDLIINFPGNAFSDPVNISTSFNDEVSDGIPKRYTALKAVSLQAVGEGKADFLEPAMIVWKCPPGEAGRAAVIQLSGGQWRELPSKVSDDGSRVMCRLWELGTVALVRDMKNTAGFSDMKGHWAEGVVSGLASQGIVSGYPGNSFDPSRPVTRAEFAVLMCKALGWQPLEGKIDFKDAGTIPDWARGYIIAAYKKGVISGYEDGTFLPARQVTRGEMAAIVSKALSLKNSDDVKLDKVFRDGKNIDKWAVGPVASVYSAGLMKGDNENKFRARDRATRAESAALVDSVLKYLFRQ
ncbi:MAG: S-layer homology domain-containing protein, partial [Desulfocucumaceae bacterium]